MDLPNYAYFEGKIVPYSQAKIGVMTHGFNYGTAVFGGIRAYWNTEQKRLFMFRPQDHFRRFLDSSRLLRMELGQTPESLLEITLEILHLENYQQDIYIRPLAYKADETIGVKVHNLKDELTIFAVPFTVYLADDTNAHVAVSSWRRVDDNVIPARGKISGAYVNSAMAKTDAQLSGYDEALVLNQDGHLSEGSAMNVFILRKDILVTPPITDNILEGITRRTVIELAKNELGIPVVERPIDRTEVYLADELMLTGTAAQITAVTEVDHRPVGNGKMGPMTTRLREVYYDAVHACLPRYSSWNVAV